MLWLLKVGRLKLKNKLKLVLVEILLLILQKFIQPILTKLLKDLQQVDTVDKSLLDKEFSSNN